jgi:hypothetical protein
MPVNQMQLKDFVKKLILFSTPLVIILLIMYICLFNAGYYPVITNSISLDAKLFDYRAHKFSNIDVLSIGSSMNLNNLDSAEIVLPGNLTTYYNFGAWGLQISDILYLVKYFTNTYKLKGVIVSSSLTDFKENSKILIPTYYELDLVNRYLPFFYCKSSIISIINRHRQYKEFMANTNDYSNLNYDEYGGVLLNIPSEKISKIRWNEELRFPNINTMNQYSKLEELVLYMKSKKIKFIYVQAPIKKSLTDKNDSNKIILGHFSKCKSIVEGNGGYYINLHNTAIYDDSLFVDQYHLTGNGSKIYTKQIVEKLGKILN